MSDAMGILRVDVEIEHHGRPGERRVLRSVMVDTGAELSWAPASMLESLGITRVKMIRFQRASGTVLERWVGYAIVHAEGTQTTDEVVFGEPGDLVLLGARTLEGMNLVVDLVGKRLVRAGPIMAATVDRRIKHVYRTCNKGMEYMYDTKASVQGGSRAGAGLSGGP